MSASLPKLNPQILEEASDWFVDFKDGDVDRATRERFDTWLRRSPEHVEAYLKIAALWEDATVLERSRLYAADELVVRARAESNVVPLGSSVTEAVGNGSFPGHRPTALTEPNNMAPRRVSRLRGLAIAACALVALTGAWLYFERGSYSTAIGEQRSLRLEDGSNVDLNSRSKVRVRYSDHERHVELLEGQALFRVTKDPSRPFVVATDNTHVRAVGTQFDVYRKSSGTVVTVLEGRVAVLSEVHTRDTVAGPTRQSAPADTALRPIHGVRTEPTGQSGTALPTSNSIAQIDEILLVAGEQLTVTGQAVSPLRSADLALATAWTQHKIVFQAASLSDVVEEFNRYNARQLVIVDPDLEGTKISGVFSSTDPDSLLRFLRELPHVDIQEAGREIRIARK